MKLEIAPREYWIKCTYNEAIIYCQFLNIDGKIGWRIPSFMEYLNTNKFDNQYGFYELLSHEKWGSNTKNNCVPVRDCYD